MAKIKFTDIVDKHSMPPHIRAKASQLLPMIIDYGLKHYNNTKKMRESLLKACNVILYTLVEQEPLPFDWMTSDPLSNIPDYDEEMMRNALKNAYLADKDIEWDLPVLSNEVASSAEYEATPKITKTSQPAKPASTAVKSASKKSASSTPKATSKPAKTYDTILSTRPTDKTDLYLQGPKVPQFDSKSVWLQGQIGYDKLVIYESLPKIPQKQSDISVTTDVTRMTNSELMRLYPNCLIRTRNEKLYEQIDGLSYDDDMGLVLPVGNFTDSQIIDNMIKYPHLYKLVRELDGQLVSFYSHIEIDGHLHKTLEIWDSLPEAKVIPKQPEFIKEYVVRRYLLERDILNIEHQYPLFGSLDPYLTLFMPSDDYIRRGYKNTREIVIQCVKSRVSFKQTRNPVIRRLSSINV